MNIKKSIIYNSHVINDNNKTVIEHQWDQARNSKGTQ